MAYSITVQIIATAPMHDLGSNIDKQARRRRRGDIVAVYPSAEVTEPPNMSTRLGFIHVTGVPDKLLFSNIKTRLTSGLNIAEKRIRHKKWRFIITSLAPARKTEFLDTHEATITWIAFRNRLKRKVVIVTIDASQDNESNSLIDSDLE